MYGELQAFLFIYKKEKRIEERTVWNIPLVRSAYLVVETYVC